MARLTALEVGQMNTHLHHGLGPNAIAGLVKKSGGAHTHTHAHIRARGVCDTKAELEAGPAGERAPGSGRPRKTDASMDKTITT